MQHYASAASAVVVCPPDHPSHTSIVSKWLNIVSHKQCHTIAQFSDGTGLGEIRMQSPSMGAPNAGGVG